MNNFNQTLSKFLITLILSMLLLMAVSGQAAASELVNLMTSEAGMHRITYQELASQGVDLANVKHRRLSLSSNGQSVPVRSKGQDKSFGRPNRFGPGGYIEFYAEASNSLYSDQRAYTLSYGVARTTIRNEKNKYQNNQPAATQYLQSKVVEDNRYYDFLSPSTIDPWHYGQLFASAAGDTPGTSVDFDLDELVGSVADLEVQVYGIIDVESEGNDHHFLAKVNNLEVGDQQFDGNVASTLSVSDVPVNAGTNTFQLFLRGIATTPFDAMGLNHIKLRYARNSTADSDYLEGYFDAGQAIVQGFTDNTATAYRRQANGTITRITRAKRDGTVLKFSNGGVGDNFVVVAKNGYKVPTVALIEDEADISSGEAEYLIISHAAFIGGPELNELVQLRQANYSVEVVDVAQIYSQFGNHIASADAIHDYIKYAAANLGTRFVALIGSDTYDYKNYKSASISYVPTKYVVTPGGFLFIRQTPSDASYGELDGDGVPDIPVGRMSVRTPAELAIVVEKIRDYEARQGYAGRILIAADKEDLGNGISFTDDVSDLIDAIPLEWAGAIRDDFKALPDLDGDQKAHDKIIAAINAGVSVTAYIGHSSQQQWSRATPPLFTANEIATLTNIDKPTLVTQWGCWNTYFVDPAGNSMGDKFLVGGENGAVTVLGASTLTTSAGERLLGIKLNQRMYEEGITIGEAVVAAKQALAITNPDASDILLGWQIIGDPALVVNP